MDIASPGDPSLPLNKPVFFIPLSNQIYIINMDEATSPPRFTLFPDLPCELRIKIWKLAEPGPRTVRIQYNMNYKSWNGKFIADFKGWTSPDPAPTILHVCQESRAEALRTYSPAFGSYFHAPKVYINFSIDTLKFDNPQKDGLGEGSDIYLLDTFLAGGYHGADDCEKVRRLVVDVSVSLYERRTFCWLDILQFEELEELTLMVADEDEDAMGPLMAHYGLTLGVVSRACPQWKVPQTEVVSMKSRRSWGTVEAR
ncbi:hypothetical protein B7494_g3580 [Chlorociboria aeruginascens]|nr:hypothetical protein B7494_g3580 [Chlorociboria aeruginascens]